MTRAQALVMLPMKFSIIFENSGDTIPFEVVHNHDLIAWFIQKADAEKCNCFFNNDDLDREIDHKLNSIHNAVSKTNEVYWLLADENFPQCNNLLDYLDQRFLNRQHALWVESQYRLIDIDQLRFSGDSRKSEIGHRLHDLYPDDIRQPAIAPVMEKLGYLYHYEEVNMTVHRLEQVFSSNREWSAKNKWANLGFDNPFVKTMVSNLDRVNFSFGYTYVGRQYYNKWQYWDSELEFTDHYNYEKLEWSFHLNLDRPETRSWSPEFLQWTSTMKVRPMATQLPIGNIIALEKNLAHYRQIVYHNAKQKNAAKLIIN
jgi:hypothetical protein